MPMNNFCLPIIKNSLSEVNKLIAANILEYGFFEIWLDNIADASNQNIIKLCHEYPNKLLFTLRGKELGSSKLSQKTKYEFIKTIAKLDCMVDLDISQTLEIDYAKKWLRREQLIISYHDYNSTLDDVYIHKVINKIIKLNPHIIKIATFCREPADALRLINIAKDFIENDKKHIVLGMGEYGEITRVFGALWGNELVYVPLTGNDQSAAGQIDKPTFYKILKGINKK